MRLPINMQDGTFADVYAGGDKNSSFLNKQKNYNLTNKISAGSYGVNTRIDNTPTIEGFYTYTPITGVNK